MISSTTLMIVVHSAFLILNFIVLFYVLNRDMELQQRHVTYVLFGTCIANCGMTIEVYSGGDLNAIWLARCVEAIGSSVIAVALLLFTAVVCRIVLPTWFTTTLFTLNIIICTIHFLDPQLHMFYESLKLAYYNDYAYGVATNGLAGILYWIVCITFPGLASVGMLVYTAIQDVHRYRAKDLAIVAVMLGSIGLVLIAHISGAICKPYNPAIAWSSVVFELLAMSKWKTQGLDVISAAAKTAVDALDGGVMAVNKYKEILYFNEAVRKIIPDIDRYLGSSIDAIEELNIPAIRPGEKAEVAIRDRRYFVQISTIYDSEHQEHGYAVLFNDMTDTFEMMDRIRLSQSKAEEAAEQKTKFLTNLSHEIRTPMNAIVGLSELIIEESRGRKVYDMAVTIKKASISLLDLVNNILDFSKLESHKMELLEEDYSLSELVTDITDLLRIPASQNGLTIKTDLDTSLPSMVRGDAGKIRQVIINLINNGIKFTKEGYVRLDISGIRRGDKVMLTFMVIDTGMGIKPEDLDRIFGDFEQVDRINNKSKEGSGLGLSICKSLVSLMGGVIDVSSVYGEGTTFTVRLNQIIVDDTPICDSEQQIDVVETDNRMFEAPDIKALIVDDNKVNVMVAKSMMSPYNLQIDTASSGKEALELVQEKDYDIIMMDHMMPEMDGIETTGHIRTYYDAKGIHPKIVALTANAYRGVKDMFLSHGFDDFMSKPVEKKAMYDMLLSLIPVEQVSYIDGELTEATYSEDDLAELFIEGVDTRGAVDAKDGNIEEYVELLDLFLLEGREKYDLMLQYAAAEDYHNYEIIVHGLKSTALNVGAKGVSEQAKTHEFAAKDGKYDIIKGDLDNLASRYLKLLDDIEALLNKRKESQVTPKEIKLQGLTTGSLKQAVSDIICLSESFRTKEAAEVVDKLLRYEIDSQAEKILSDVRMKYKLYDDDGAEELLHQLLESLKD